MTPLDPASLATLHLTLTPGLGPILIDRAIEAFGSAEAVLGISPAQLERVRGIGKGKSGAIVQGMREAAAHVDAELALASKLAVRMLFKGREGYPPLMADLPGAPTLLYVRGEFDPSTQDQFAIAIVGSRHCSAYGVEQAERFAGIFARAGITVVSGGARGIDTAAHRGALRSQGRTILVAGCGLSHCYPPENAEIMDKILSAGGSVISELPLATAPTPENFPPRNRIISGLSLAVLVVEAGLGSGALITAKVAAEDQGREVFALPGRVDSPTSRGSLHLLKTGGATLVTDPADIIEALAIPAAHVAKGTFVDRYAVPPPQEETPLSQGSGLFAPAAQTPPNDPLWAALVEPRTIDQLSDATSIPTPELRARLTMLELQKRVRRQGPKFERA